MKPGNGPKLTEDEIKLGWHFCPGWGMALTSPIEAAQEPCSCFPVPSSSRYLIESDDVVDT